MGPSRFNFLEKVLIAVSVVFFSLRNDITINEIMILLFIIYSQRVQDFLGNHRCRKEDGRFGYVPRDMNRLFSLRFLDQSE
jgi:hypothetical protein